MALTKCTATVSKIYLNNGINLTENAIWQQNLTPVNYGSLAWGDVNNDGWLDLFLNGCNSGGGYTKTCDNASSILYLNNGSTLLENLSWKGDIVDVWRGSVALGDVDMDGDVDMVLTGLRNNLSKIGRIYLNNGTSFEEDLVWQLNLTSVDASAVVFADIDNDQDLDLILSGETQSNDGFTNIYLNNGSTLISDSTWSTPLDTDDGSLIFGDFDNDGDLDLSLIGCCDYLRIYENNGMTLVQIMRETVDGLVGVFAGSEMFGDYDNDGDLDLITTGREMHTYLYLYNGTSFTISTQDPESHITDLEYSHLVWGDLDVDGSLDLITSGWSTSIDYEAFVYINNITTPKNTPPDPPAVASLAASYADGRLALSWANASDNQTPTAGLYYNLRVGTSSGGHEIVTGVYGGGDDNGYFGNMMQRRNITLNRQLDAGTTVYWAVQTIDTGLAAGNWTAEQTYEVPGEVLPWSGNVTSIPATYSPTAPSVFNISWTGNVSHVFLESNFSGAPANYSMANITASVFNFSAVLAAGSHYWKSFANSTYGLWNVTLTWLFTINKATPGITLDLGGVDADTSMDEDTSIWLNVTLSEGDSSGEMTLYVDSALLANESAPLANNTLFAEPGVYNISALYGGSQNYTANSTSHLLTVNDTTVPEVANLLPIAGTNYQIGENATLSANVADNVNVSHAWANVTWQNGSVLVMFSPGTAPAYTGSFANTSEAGRYNVTFHANDTANNVNGTETTWFNVTEAPDTVPPGWSAPTESPADPATYSQTANYTFNVTWTDAYAIALVQIEHNFTGALQNYTVGTQQEGTYTYAYGSIAVGAYAWRMLANDSSGNANATPYYSYNVTRAAPVLNLTIGGIEGNTSVDEDTATWLNGSLVTGDPGAALSLYLDGSLIGTGTAPANLTNFTTPRLYNITLVYSETQNYSVSSVTYWLTVNDTTAPAVQSHSPTGTVTSSSATLTATTNENSTCRYSASSGVAYENMSSAMSGNTTSHAASLSGLTDGTYHYYIRCNNTAGLVATSDYDASFTVDIADTPGSGGGGGGSPVTDQNVKETTYASLSAGRENTLHVDRSAIPATKVGFMNTAAAQNVKLSVSTVNTSTLTDPLVSAYGYFNVTLSGLDADELGGAWIEFRVNTSWISEQGATKGDVRLKRQGTAWDELDTAWMKDSGAYSYYNASTPGFSVFAIALMAKAPPVVSEPEPEVNITEPEANATGPPAEPPAEPPVEQPEKPGRRTWLLALNAAALAALAAAGIIYRRKRGALRRR